MKNLAFYSDLTDKYNSFAVTDRFLQVNCTGQAVYPYKAFGRSVRRDYYLLYLWQGEIAVKRPQIDRHLLPGDFLLFPPGEVFDYTAISEGTLIYYWVHFSGSAAAELLATYRLPVGKRASPGLSDAIVQRFLALFPPFTLRGEFFQADAAEPLLALFAALGHALAESSTRGLQEATAVSKASAYIHAHLAEPALSVEALADAAFMSAGHTGISPKDYIISHRLRLACELLRQTNRPIAEIARATGYPDSHYFTRLFTARMGQTPTAYRREGR